MCEPLVIGELLVLKWEIFVQPKSPLSLSQLTANGSSLGSQSPAALAFFHPGHYE